MTTLAHGNFWLHHMLTDQGACSHVHTPESFEDDGDAESGPHLSGGPAFDEYQSESHSFIVDGSGSIVATMATDWDLERYMAGFDDAEYFDMDQYVRRRHIGEDWIVRYRDEDGAWYAQAGKCWTSDRREAHHFTHLHALQIAHAFNLAAHDRIVGLAVVEWVVPVPTGYENTGGK